MKVTAVVFGLLLSQFAWGHAGEHAQKVAKCAAQCTEAEIREGAKAAIKMIAAKSPDKAAFENADLTSVELKQFKKGKEWVAQFTKADVQSGNKDLYVFITTDGKLNGSNFTGK